MTTLRSLMTARLCLFALLFCGPLVAQPQPGSREAMWPAATAEQWRKPVTIKWQRTFEDAMAVAKESGRPILLAVNMDGEIASEHWAGIRYRDPAVGKLFTPYVPVIASTYRHNPRDYDADGNRIPCPRFGTVTCGEHIAIEPALYARYMDGARIAPRHICIEVNGQETFDVFYALDVVSVLDRIEQGAKGRPAPRPKGDRPLLERVASRDVADREAVERAYREGDRDMRSALLAEATKLQDDAPIEVLRLAAYGLDLEQAKTAREALAQQANTAATDLINETLSGALATEEREALVGALERIGKSSPLARRLATVHRGLDGQAASVDFRTWVEAMGADYEPAPLVAEEERNERFTAATETIGSKDPVRHLELAEAFLAEARAMQNGLPGNERMRRVHMEDAHERALEAERLGASGFRLHSIVAVTAYERGEGDEALRRAELAMETLPERPMGANTLLVLRLYAEARHRRIVAAVEAEVRFEPSLLADMNAAHDALLAHPDAADSYAVSHYDFLLWLGARRQGAEFLDRAVAIYPSSSALHQRLREHLRRRHGVRGLLFAYERMLAAEDASPALPWFAGYAAMEAAEMHRRRGRDDKANAAYEQALKRFATSIEQLPNSKSSSDYWRAVCMAGQARVAMESTDYDRALERILAAFDAHEPAVPHRDGLNLSAADTAFQLRQRLKEAKRDADFQRLLKRMNALDPKLLEMADFERSVRVPNGGRTPPGGNSGGR